MLRLNRITKQYFSRAKKFFFEKNSTEKPTDIAEIRGHPIKNFVFAPTNNVLRHPVFKFIEICQKIQRIFASKPNIKPVETVPRSEPGYGHPALAQMFGCLSIIELKVSVRNSKIFSKLISKIFGAKNR